MATIRYLDCDLVDSSTDVSAERVATLRPRPKERDLVPPKIRRSVILDDGVGLKQSSEDSDTLQPTIKIVAQGLALYDYDPDGADGCIPLIKGAKIRLTLAKSGLGWWEGYCQELHGAFPETYVEIIAKEKVEPLAESPWNRTERANQAIAPPLPINLPPPPEEQYRALYDWSAESPDQLSFEANEIILVMSKVSV